MSKDSIIGIDLAKNIFHVCVMNKMGRVLSRHRVSRKQLFEFVTNRYEGVVAVEACGGAHYWARRFSSAGYGVRIIAAQFVKPFVKSNKNDQIDAEAICEAASRPQMRFVTMRSEQQQDIQNLHRIRERLVRQRTSISNEIRGFLLEYGIVIPKGISQVRNKLAGIIDEESSRRSDLWLRTFRRLLKEFQLLDEEIVVYEKEIKQVAKDDIRCQKLLKIPGVGDMTATAVVAAVGDAKDFQNGRNFSAWLGLTPRQHTTGGKVCLGRISKRGDKYIRKLLFQGARACAIAAEKKRNNKDALKRTLNMTEKWLFGIAGRRGSKRAIAALANKNARRIWAVLCKEKDFMQPEELLKLAA